MKKICALLLALLLCTSAAMAAQWADGLGPAQPYTGVPAVNLDEKLGYMMFYPNAKTGAMHCCRSLCIYLPREDVTIGSGMLYLCSEERGEEIRLAFEDAETVRQRPMTEAELSGLMWGGGTCFEVKLPYALNLNEGYFVNLEGNCIVSTDGKVGNPTIGGTESWAFRTDADYGVAAMEYTRPSPIPDGAPEGRIATPAAGDDLQMEILLGGEATMAVFHCADGSVEFSVPQTTEGGLITGKVLAAKPAWTVIFLDAEMRELSVLEMR